jgi:hypothetical protein
MGHFIPNPPVRGTFFPENEDMPQKLFYWGDTDSRLLLNVAL